MHKIEFYLGKDGREHYKCPYIRTVDNKSFTAYREGHVSKALIAQHPDEYKAFKDSQKKPEVEAKVEVKTDVPNKPITKKRSLLGNKKD